MVMIGQEKGVQVEQTEMILDLINDRLEKMDISDVSTQSKQIFYEQLSKVILKPIIGKEEAENDTRNII